MVEIKRVVVAMLLACAMMVPVACSRVPQLSKPARSDGDGAINVTGACEAKLLDGGQVLHVSGECSLMDGTNGIVCILNANGWTVEKLKFTLESDTISFDFPVTADWPATVYGLISFDTQQCDRQPSEVTETYGNRFQNLEGPDVIWDTKGVVAVFQSDPVVIRAESAQT